MDDKDNINMKKKNESEIVILMVTQNQTAQSSSLKPFFVVVVSLKRQEANVHVYK